MRSLAFLCLVLSTPLLVAQEQPKKANARATGATEKWTVDDVLLAEHAGDWRIAPDGRTAVWVKRVMDKDKGEALSHLVLTPLAPRSKAEGENIELTRGTESCTEPRWSPDGRRIGFLSSRPAPKAKAGGDDKDEAKTQIWLINPKGGEPWPLTEATRDVRDFDWADADTIVFAAQEKVSHLEATLKEKKDTSQVVEDEEREPPVRLYKIDVKEKKIVRLTDNKDRIQSLALSPDGKWAVTIHERSLRYTFDHKIKPVVFLHEVATGQGKQVFERGFNIKEIHWTPDSKGFYAVNAFTSHADYLMAYIAEVHHYDVAGRSAVKVALDWPHGLSDAAEPSLTVTPDGFVTLLANGARPKAARYTRAGTAWSRQWLTGDHAAQLFNVNIASDGKTLVYLHSTASSPDQWYRARLEGNKIVEPVAITELEPDFKKKPRARTELVRWKGALDEDVEGILYYPHDYDEARQDKYPLVVMIHGGPAGADFDNWGERWAYPANLVCARGAFVFKPNYHGSTNYGLKFVESIANGKYYLPVVDIEKGIDALAARGLIDPTRVALSGWSNGAILTMSLITRSPRYLAACAGAGGSEWVADWGACEFGMSFSNYYLGKSPLEDPQVYFKNAPFYDFAKVRTPTLLFHGTQDRVVPSHHAWMQYRALQQLGKTDVRLVLFPDEKHSLKKYAHQKRKIQEELAWLDKYLFKTYQAADEALKADSPLAVALERNKARREGGRYGVLYQGMLIPETVAAEDKFKGIQVGRFEVTRAQFARFDKSYAIEPGQENYPANGITLDQARAYCAWLSKLTGEIYRLPTEDEFTKLLDDATGPENTLDTWAGYTVNPEDAVRLQEKLRELPGKAPLLKEVGSFKGQGKTPLFDLGGNVAEWATSSGSGGKARGGSADRPTEERSLQAALEYIGFRVVLSK